MSGGTTYVVGGGLAGLSAGVTLAGRGRRVEVLEGAAQAGGRCRSYLDPQLGMTIDNGNHLVLSGNQAVQEYLAQIGAVDRLAGPGRCAIAFADLASGERWTLRPNDGPVPWWIFNPQRRPPRTRPADFMGLLGLIRPSAGRRVDQAITCQGPLWDRLMRPFLLAVLNAEPEAGDAGLAAAVINQTLVKGGQACRPRIATPNLSAAFVDPAVAFIEAHGGAVRLGRRVRRLNFGDGRLQSLSLPDGEITLGENDAVILATPPWAAQELLPGLEAPDEFRAIVNGHFQTPAPAGAASIVGLVGGLAEWVFAFPDRISVTVSAADRLLDMDRETLAQALWADVAKLHRLPAELPPWQIVKERRATFAATPSQQTKRPGPRTHWENLFLAGDWTDTGLPATIEGALRSGRTAAALALARPVR